MPPERDVPEPSGEPVKVTEFEHGLVLSTPTHGYIRTPGLHASDIYGAFYKSLDPKRYDKRQEDGSPIPMDETRMTLGTSFEEVLEIALAARLLGERPGEFTSPEGVIFSPDYLFNEEHLVLGEFKCTWYSAKDAPFGDKFLKWWTQIKLYCYWLRIHHARLYVLFVNGDYKPPAPVLRAWSVEFTDKELQGEYTAIMRFAHREGMLGKV